MLIRREAAGDAAAIRAVTAAAFAGPAGLAGPAKPAEPVEAALVDDLRADPAWLPALSLVALSPAAAGHGGDVVGHVVCTRGHVGQAPVLALGPLSVHPDSQGRGVGSALMHAVLGAADALGEPLVALLGSPDYYGRFGFRLSGEYGIAPPQPQWRPHFQVRVLTAYQPRVRGAFAYPSPFDRV